MQSTNTDLQLLVVADSLLTRVGLSALLEEQGCTVLARVDGADLQRDIDLVAPDALVIDMGWSPAPMRERLSQVESDLPILALVAISQDEEEEYDQEDETLILLQTLRLFPRFALLPHDSQPATIAAALAAIESGLTTLDPRFSRLLGGQLHGEPTPSHNPLTPRENEVLQLLARGLTNRAIAFQLGITQHTVKFHVNAIMGKLAAQSRTEAVVRATQLGMIRL